MSISGDPKHIEHRRGYYDAFSEGYDRGRDRGYHAFLDRAELSVILPAARGKRVLEAGCGTGLLLEHVARQARTAVGVDLSAGMLQKARERGLDVIEGDLHSLPFEDESFDLVYSCKVLAHVPDLPRTLHELNRVVAPGGRLLLEFYNRRSLRFLVRRLRPGMATSAQHHDGDVYTRFDTEEEVLRAAPASWTLQARYGIRVATLVPQIFALPLLGPLWNRLEESLVRSPIAGLGGFLLLDFHKAAPSG